MKRLFRLLALFLSAPLWAAGPTRPVLFVTQTPMPTETNTRTVSASVTSVVSPFGNHLGATSAAGRGGALMLFIPPAGGGTNGTTRNLTLAAGFGLPAAPVSGSTPVFQGSGAIAVRDPCVHWSGTKAVFSMVVGAPSGPGDATVFYWQLYEVATNFTNPVAPVTVTKVPNQPANFNNVSPCYGTDGRIIFVSDQPRNGAASLYPQLDEYLLLPTNTGLWSLDPTSGNLFQLEDSPSGSFNPFIDSAGRVIFSRWDHLSRDAEALSDTLGQTTNGTFNFSDETAAATMLPRLETYPEPRDNDPSLPPFLTSNSFNEFFPWQINEDGTAEEVIDHLGRHELIGSIPVEFTNDPSLVAMSAATRPNVPGTNVSRKNQLGNFMEIAEDPLHPGNYFGVDAIDLGTHGAGRIVSFNAPFGGDADYTTISYVSASPASLPIVVPANPNPTPLATPIDLYRSPLPMSDGTLVAIHTPATITDSNQPQQTGGQPDPAFPKSRYIFRLKTLVLNGSTQIWGPGTALTPGFNGNLTYYNGATLVTYNGPLWELDPVEVVARTAPQKLVATVAGVEQQVFTAAGVDLPTFQNYLRKNNWALMISRNVTTRDHADQQQPYNLQIAWPQADNSHVTTLGSNYPPRQLAFLQIMQADQLRGYTGSNTAGAPAMPGRRVLAVPMHDAISENPPSNSALPGSVQLGSDGSIATIVPARRAITWHLTDTQANGFASQIKERYWLNFQPGEIRTCTSCHGINTTDQAGNPAPTNPPLALANLLAFWKSDHPAGTLQLAFSNYLTTKTTAVTVTVTRANGSTGPLTVQYQTSDGTAIAGQDYTVASGALSWLDGDTAPKTVTILILNNPQIGPTKAFTIALSGSGGQIGGQPNATISVTEPPFNAWLYQRYGANANTAAIGGALADPDGNGVPNLSKYAFNLSGPLQSPLLRPPYSEIDSVTNQQHLTITYTRRKPPVDITYHVETSRDLKNWTEGAGSVEELSSVDDSNGITQTVQARSTAPIGSAPGFIRVRVTQP